MLKTVMKLFKPNHTSRERLEMAIDGLTKSRQEAVLAVDAAKSLMTQAAQATAAGDFKAPEIADRALRAFDSATENLRRIDAMIEAARAGLSDEDRKDRERATEINRREAEKLLDENEDLAEEIAGHIEGLARCYDRHLEIMSKVYGLMPILPRDLQHFNLQAVITEQLGLATNDVFGNAINARNIIGINRSRVDTGRKARGGVLNVVETAQRHGDLLMAQFPREAA